MALSDAIADMFDDENLTEPAVYLQGSTLIDVRVARRMNAADSSLLNARANVVGTEIRILKSQISAPASGDKIAVGYASTDTDVSVAGFWNEATILKVRQARPSPSGLSWILDVQELIA